MQMMQAAREQQRLLGEQVGTSARGHYAGSPGPTRPILCHVYHLVGPNKAYHCLAKLTFTIPHQAEQILESCSRSVLTSKPPEPTLPKLELWQAPQALQRLVPRFSGRAPRSLHPWGSSLR